MRHPEGVHFAGPDDVIAALAGEGYLADQGLATAVTAALCRRLLETVDVVTLNVRADNAAAIAVYHRLGFVVAGDYDESDVTARG